ncbi:hypothetical protein BDF20DRAFT_913901 [Mycotypha africana]|uniref:uncharacterized protein n=1 Tax=Mycotypha africana TaxID=64632 RepID=UPI002300B2A7|nr:uncharacterized protein BDF20DRAFT_913901 [Mycotypha africana]KAI8977586.1 hypothetical protein BDF20DRAFT_913901 [Mycotypha africana]
MAEPMEVDQKTEPLFVDVLSLINESRMTYGLRNEDYQRYREYCANRVRRLRQILKLSQPNSKKTNVQKPLPAVVTDVRYLQLFIYESERAWAYAMELKQESANSMDTRYHYHLIKRLKRAAQYAQQLLDLCQQQNVDARSILDVKAYTNVLRGYLSFEQQNFQEALNHFIIASYIYEQFAETNSNAEQEALCYSAIDEIAPNIRFCAYKMQISDGQDAESIIKKHRSKEVDDLEAELAKIAQNDKKKNARSMLMLTWRDKEFAVKNESLADAVHKAREARSKLDKMSEMTTGLFDEIISEWAKAEKLCKKALKENKQATAKVASSRSAKVTEDLNQLFTFIEYNLYSTTIQRDLCKARTIEKDGRLQEIIRLYDEILKNAEYIWELPQVKDDISLDGELQTMTLYYKACRCVQVALIYDNMKKTAESLALYQKAQNYVVQAKKGLSDVRSFDKDSILKISEKDLTDLEESIRAGTWKARAAWYLEHGNSSSNADDESNIVDKMSGLDISEGTLIDNLDTYPSIIRKDMLIDFPPKFEPVACKPFYFDLAANFVKYPDQALHDRTKSSSSGGFWGLFGRKQK